jgi:hypothetical protein
VEGKSERFWKEKREKEGKKEGRMEEDQFVLRRLP